MKHGILRVTSGFIFVLLIMSGCSKTDMQTATENVSATARSKAKFDDQLSNQVILDWNLAALEAQGGVTYLHALFSSRADAMMHIAMHDALNAITPVYEQYAYHNSSGDGADPVLAAAQAAYTVLGALYPAAQPTLDNLRQKYLAMTPDGAAEQKALMVGEAAGMAILTLRQNDGATQDPVGPMAVSDVPGVYNTVPPFTFVFGEFWKNMEPFSLESPDQFRSSPPPALTSMEYAKDFNEIKELGGTTSTIRTPDQIFYAAFWYEYVEIGWNRIARIVAVDQDLGLWSSARLFALMNMAITDSYTAGWDAKFYYNFWRPYTAIRAAALDGNPRTAPDATWESFLPTPPVPDYPSTHSVGANAAATVLTMLTKGNMAFTTSSSTAVPMYATRSFRNFKQAADENADSRVVAGIHFRFATEAGQDLGDAIGKWTVRNYLEPIKKNFE